MVMSVNTNISSLNAQRNLASSQSKLATAIARLSSGMRINSAKDDAAGLAISTRFTTQINGLNQAAANASDGISLAQTTESALNEVTNNMQRIRTLAVQSANASNSDSDRAALDAEVQQRLSEITRISQQTTFNGRHVLDGTFGSAAFQIGANVGETISVNLSQGTGTSQMGNIATSATGDISAMFASPAGLTLAAGDLTVDMGAGAGAVNVAAGTYTDAASLITAINAAAGSTIAAASGSEIVFTNSSTTNTITFAGSAAAGLGMTTVAAGTAGTSATPGTASSTGLGAAITGAFNSVTLAAGDFTLDGVDVTGTFKDSTELAAAINAQSAGLATVDGSDHIVLTNSGGTAIAVAGGRATSLGLAGSLTSGGGTVTATDTTANYVTTNANAVEAGAGEFQINGADVTGVFSDAASLKALIDAQSITGLTTTVTAGELDFSNSGSSAVTFGGSLSLGLPTTVDAQTPAGSPTSGTATSTGVDAAVTAPSSGAAPLVLASSDLTIGSTDMSGTYKDAQSLVDAINSKGIDGVSAYYDSNTKSVHLNSQSDLTVAGAKSGSGELGFSGAGAAIAADSSLADSSIKTVAGAYETISHVDAALNTISSIRSDLGAVQNRFESTISNLQTISQNLSASRSQIMDADFAAETANMTSANILQQAGVSVLAQANASTQGVLRLLQ